MNNLSNEELVDRLLDTSYDYEGSGLQKDKDVYLACKTELLRRLAVGEEAISGNIMKSKYDIYIILPRESFHFYRCAYSERQALERGVSEIAKKQGVMKELVWGYIKEHPECYKVEKIEGGKEECTK